MAPAHNLVTRAAEMATSATATSPSVYPNAILLSILSFIVILLITPPMCWHYRNRNIGATMLVAWTIIMNLQNFINPLIWPNDDTEKWYNGVGLCDIEVKIQAGSEVAAAAALACVLRALAGAMNTERATLVKTKAQRMRTYAIDVAACIGLPLLMMLFQFIVQPNRYFIFGISGCLPSVTNNAVTLVLLYIPPILLTLVDTVYAVTILVRLLRYRRSFAAVLANSNTTKSRFMRLYIFCITCILGLIPFVCYTFAVNLNQPQTPFSWSETHNPATWNTMIMMPSHGTVLFDRWMWLGAGIAVFIFFGMGKEAVGMYRAGLLAAGFGRVFPSLLVENRGRRATEGTVSSFGSKARLFFKRKSSVASWRTESVTSRTTSISSPASPKDKKFLETIDENHRAAEKAPRIAVQSSKRTSDDIEKVALAGLHSSTMSRIASILRLTKANARTDGDFSLSDMTGQQSTIRADVSASRSSTALSDHGPSGGIEVIVRKEVRQGSETTDGDR